MRGLVYGMPAPSTHITISGSAVAIYAAIVSTITGSVQLWHFFRDRARIRLTVQRNMEIIGGPVHRKGLTLVKVANRGRRPVTIATVGAHSLFPHDSFVILECNPQLPHELTEGKTLMAIIPPCDLDFSRVSYWEACDAVGRAYRLYAAPWYARVLSNFNWRRKWKRDKKKKQTARTSR
jgi:hypothetical protein